MFDARPRDGDSAPGRLGEGDCCRDARLSGNRGRYLFTSFKTKIKKYYTEPTQNLYKKYGQETT